MDGLVIWSDVTVIFRSLQVYLCVDLDTGKEMAMKCVETGAINTATLKEVEVLKREIQLYKTLKHERIVSYFGTWQDNRSISIFMEYMVGVRSTHLIYMWNDLRPFYFVVVFHCGEIPTTWCQGYTHQESY